MSAAIINGKQIAEEIKFKIKQETDHLKAERGITPGLAFILVGDNPASQSYVKMKEKGCNEVGFYSITEKLSGYVSEEIIIRLIEQLNNDPQIHGILTQLPLPSHIREDRILGAIDYRKDVDGFHPINAGRLLLGQPCFVPCTPLGVQELLIHSGNYPSGKHVVVVGRSHIVGKPLANLLMQKNERGNAIVTVVHSSVKDISLYTRQADILIVAIGSPEFITGEMVKKGGIVIDVGINRVKDNDAKIGYRITGDVHFQSVVNIASAITPVPGGVGPMTIAILLRNTLWAASRKIYSE